MSALSCIEARGSHATSTTAGAYGIGTGTVSAPATETSPPTITPRMAGDDEKKNRIPWSGDGPKGPDDTNNSEAILMDWLCRSNNYRDYCGNIRGKKKMEFAKEVEQEIKSAGIPKARTAVEIVKKIAKIETQFKAALKFATTATGAGLRSDGDLSFAAKLNLKCPYFERLEPIMSDRMKFGPKVTSDTLFATSTTGNKEDNEDKDNIQMTVAVDDTNIANNDDVKKEGSKNHVTKKSAVASVRKKPEASNYEAKMEDLVDVVVENVKKRKATSTPAQSDSTATTNHNFALYEKFMIVKSDPTMTEENIRTLFPDFAIFLPKQEGADIVGASTGSSGGDGNTGMVSDDATKTFTATGGGAQI